ncbi:MAG: hypothetical protein R3D80_14325 [Paracoccaceae bacterium]
MLDKDQMGEFIEANAKDIMDDIATAVLKAWNPTPAWTGKTGSSPPPVRSRAATARLAQALSLSRKFQVFETSSLKLVSNRRRRRGRDPVLQRAQERGRRAVRLPNSSSSRSRCSTPAPYTDMPVLTSATCVEGAEVAFLLSVYNPEGLQGGLRGSHPRRPRPDRTAALPRHARGV